MEENRKLDQEFEVAVGTAEAVVSSLETTTEIPDDTESDTDIVIPEGMTSNVETIEEIEKEENDKPAKKMAKEKLEKELKNAKDKTFAEPVIGYLLERCEEDAGLSADILQEHKTWNKCLDYIYEQAKKQATGDMAAVREDIVYEWAEDYYHKDDKAEEEKKAKEAAERKKKQEERAKKMKSESAKEETPKPKEEPKSKKNNKDMDGQIDMFSMMGM